MRVMFRVLYLTILTTLSNVNIFSNASQLKKQTSKDVFEGLKLFSETLSMIKQKSLRNVDIKSFVEEGLKSGLSKIDPHSSFISNYEQISDSISGNFSGIGVSVIGKNNEDENLLIIDVLDGSPAQKAGLMSGDRVFAVDDQKLRGLSCEEVVGKMRGKKHTVVKLKILRNKKILEIDVTRDTIADRSSFGYYFENQKVYYVNLKSFSENAPKQMSKLIAKINHDTDCKGLILDLRANPGGIMESAIDVASIFLPKKSLIVSTKDKNGNLINDYHTHQSPILQKDLIFFVLVNNFTASAAEILAGALRHHSRELEKNAQQKYRPLVFILGTTTFGKGSVQEVIPLAGNNALKLTSMLYFLPNGESIQAKGVKPDFVMMPTRTLSTEEKFLYELYGMEKTMYHHVTADEVQNIVAKKEPEKHSVIDKKTSQTISKLEEEKQKSEISKDKPDKEDLCNSNLDCGDMFETIIKKHKNKIDEEEAVSQKAKERQEKAIAEDFYVKNSLSMINYLYLLKKAEPEKTKNFSSCQKALEDTFLLKNNLKMLKLE